MRVKYIQTRSTFIAAFQKHKTLGMHLFYVAYFPHAYNNYDITAGILGRQRKTAW